MRLFWKYIARMVASMAAFLPRLTKAYDFSEESGIQETAKGTGHNEMGIFTPGNLAGGVGTLISAALSFLGVLFLLLTLYGGYLWMTSAGNDEQVSKAKKILTSAVIGLIIIVAAYAVTAAIGNYLL